MTRKPSKPEETPVHPSADVYALVPKARGEGHAFVKIGHLWEGANGLTGTIEALPVQWIGGASEPFRIHVRPRKREGGGE